MTRNRIQRLLAILAIVAGWVALVADQPPSSTVDSEVFTGTVMLSPDRPEVRVPFDLEFTQDEDDPGGSGLTIDVVHSWAGVAPDRLTVTIETPTGSVEIDTRYFVCRDCEEPGELVIQWPWWEKEGSVVVTWTATAALSYDTDTPPAGASVAFDMEVPPIEIEERRINPVEALQNPIQSEKLTVEGTPDPADQLRVAWPGWYADPKEVPNAVLIRWGDRSAILAPGLAVEIPVTELCTPGCEAEVTYFLDREPGHYVGPWDLIAPLTAAFVGGSSAEVKLGTIPVPSSTSTRVEREVSIPPEPGQEVLTLTIETDPFTGDPPAVARIAYTMESPDTLNWEPHGDLRVDVGEHSFLRLSENGEVGSSRAFVPLDCDASACTAALPVILYGRFAEPVSVFLSFDVDIFHPDANSQAVRVDLTGPE